MKRKGILTLTIQTGDLGDTTPVLLRGTDWIKIGTNPPDGVVRDSQTPLLSDTDNSKRGVKLLDSLLGVNGKTKLSTQ